MNAKNLEQCSFRKILKCCDNFSTKDVFFYFSKNLILKIDLKIPNIVSAIIYNIFLCVENKFFGLSY